MQNNKNIFQLEPSWFKLLQAEFKQPYMRVLEAFLIREQQQHKNIYPQQELIFNAYNSTPFDEVKVVIIGQDPYHGVGQAHGLCFSVLPDVRIPPSLLNIYKELEQDVGFIIPKHGYLQSWAEQGVLLLNSTLTVEDNKAGSHQGKGWELFTDKTIQLLNDQKENLVFILWGAYAQNKGQFVNTEKHLVVKGPHPSPLSAHRGFFGKKYFSSTNQYLVENNIMPIQWQLPRLPQFVD